MKDKVIEIINALGDKELENLERLEAEAKSKDLHSCDYTARRDAIDIKLDLLQEIRQKVERINE